MFLSLFFIFVDAVRIKYNNDIDAKYHFSAAITHHLSPYNHQMNHPLIYSAPTHSHRIYRYTSKAQKFQSIRFNTHRFLFFFSLSLSPIKIDTHFALLQLAAIAEKDNARAARVKSSSHRRKGTTGFNGLAEPYLVGVVRFIGARIEGKRERGRERERGDRPTPCWLSLLCARSCMLCVREDGKGDFSSFRVELLFLKGRD